MPWAITVSNMNILGQKLNEVLRRKPTDGRTGGRTDKTAEVKNVYNVFFDKHNDDALRLFIVR